MGSALQLTKALTKVACQVTSEVSMSHTLPVDVGRSLNASYESILERLAGEIVALRWSTALPFARHIIMSL